jgi:hypothetical protein
VVSVGPYQLELVPLYAGPLLSAPEGSEAHVLAVLLSHAVEQPDLALALERGALGGDAVVYVQPAENAGEDCVLREAWALRAGEQLGALEVARVGMMGRDEPVPVPWKALRAALDDLRARRADWTPEPGPWLFTRPARSPFVTPEDLALVQRLEGEAGAVDALDLEADVGREPTTLLARRREFLRACREAGVFALDHGRVREQWLGNWSARRLYALRQAAARLHEWGLLEEAEEPPDGRVCLDYVRLELWPPGEDGSRWAHSALALLADERPGEQGIVIERVAGSSLRVWWRRDAQRRALLAVARG